MVYEREMLRVPWAALPREVADELDKIYRLNPPSRLFTRELVLVVQEVVREPDAPSVGRVVSN